MNRARTSWLVASVGIVSACTIGITLYRCTIAEPLTVPARAQGTTGSSAAPLAIAVASMPRQVAKLRLANVHVTNPNLFSVATIGEHGFLAVGSDGQIWRKAARASNFEALETDTSAPLSGVACHPQTQTCFAFGAEGVLWRSTDRGQSFVRVPLGTRATLRALDCSANAPGVVVVGEGGAIFRSRDDGASFAKESSIGSGFLGHVVYLESQHAWFAAGENGTLLRSQGNGQWQACAFPSSRLITCLHASSDKVLLAADDGGALFRSADGGHSFAKVLDDRSLGYVTTLASDPSRATLLGVTSLGVILRSRDGGRLFEVIERISGTPHLASVHLEGAAGYLVAGNDANLYRLGRDATATQKIDVPHASDLEAAAYSPSTRESIVVGKGGFVARVDEGGATPVVLREAATRHINAVAYHAASNALVAVGTDEGALRSTDGGSSWNTVNLPVGDGTTMFGIAASVRTGTLLAAGTGAALLRSTDGGRTFESVRVKEESFSTVYALPDGGFLAAPIGEGVIRSVDDGKSFVRSAIDPNVSIVEFGRMKTTLVAIGQNGGLFYSTNLGKRFLRSSSDCEVDLRSMAMGESALVVVGASGQIHRSTDEGRSYENVDSGVEENLLSVAYGASQRTFVAVGNQGTILTSSDQGVTWRRFAPQSTERMRLVLVDPATEQFAIFGHQGALLVSRDGKDFVESINHTQAKLGAYTYHSSSKQLIVFGERLLRLSLTLPP